MSYETLLPYSATDPDNAVCPIPLLERPGYSSTSRYLDREVRVDGRRRNVDGSLFLGCHPRNNGMEEHE